MAKSIRLNKQLRADIITNIMSSYDKANPMPLRPEMKRAKKYVNSQLLNKVREIVLKGG